MPIESQPLAKSIRKLRKTLKHVPPKPSSGQVHDLRTRSRHVESIMHALTLDQSGSGQRLYRTIESIRKKAGKVRDMDVLTSFARALGADESEALCQARLLAHLGEKRARYARNLHHIITRKQDKKRKALKRYGIFFREHSVKPQTSFFQDMSWKSSAVANALQLSACLAAWPRLDASNLHAFRLKVKQLGDVIKLTDEADGAFLEALNETKDAIGEWHDWNDLQAVAVKLLDHGPACSLRKQIGSIVEQKLAHALRVASLLKKNCFLPENCGGESGLQVVEEKIPVPIASSKILA